MINSVRQLLSQKGMIVWSIEPTNTVYEALWLMAEKDIGSLLVMDNNELVGIMTERDYARKVILRGRPIHDTLVGEIMSRPVYTVHPDQNINECLELMADAHIRHLPVVEYGRVIGIVSMRDVMEEVIFQQTETIRFWEDLTLER